MRARLSEVGPGASSGHGAVRDIAVLRDRIEDRLRALAPAGLDPLSRAVRHGLLAPGKRIRPLATLLAARELGGRDLAALDPACALEMIHAASLILDDLPCMDDAALRRGRPATHVAYGQDVAILAAIALMARAYGVASGAADLAPAIRAEVVSILAEAAGPAGLAGGQFRDLHGGGGLGALADVNHLKTGVLFVAAMDVAVAVAGAPDREAERLRAAAAHLGQAFQLQDDLDDGSEMFGTPAEDRGKTTLYGMLGPEDAARRLAAHVGQALDGLQAGGVFATFVAGLFPHAARVRLDPIRLEA